MAIKKLDLTQDNRIRISIDQGVIYAPSISNLPVLDNNYTINLYQTGSVVKTYSVGNGISLVDTTDVKSIVWGLDGTQLEKGIYEGYLKSDSRVSGTYLKIKIELTVI